MTKPTSQYHQRFREELGRLNPAQKEAVEQTEGPVLVVAGPGTGKTHILAARIGQILLSTDTSEKTWEGGRCQQRKKHTEGGESGRNTT